MLLGISTLNHLVETTKITIIIGSLKPDQLFWKMSESEEEENYCFFGKPLEPYDEDAFPKKKPISIEDQIATDAQGRRRFHGAFTGGFSAGFFNTVGSLEGWTPSEFKSTRQEKAHGKDQKPEDFMDDEDIGEFGIAPQTVRATSDYATSKKRRRQVFSDGPIPGEPVLHSLLTSGNETIGYLLLKNIGLRDMGSMSESECPSHSKVYGCEMPKNYEILRNDDVYQYIIPNIYKEFLQKPKNNTFGLGYKGLEKSHINLFKTSNLVIKEGNNKKVSITGQAFGVGAFEDDDEDIYVKDDMSKYDFELTSEKTSKKDSLPKSVKTVFDDFVLAKNMLPPKEVFLPPTIPHSFTGKHKVKRSRFEPLPLEAVTTERKDMNPEIRAKYLGEEADTPRGKSNDLNINTMINKNDHMQTETNADSKCEESTPRNATKSSDLFSMDFDRFVSASTTEDPSNILEEVRRSETTHGTNEMRDAVKLKMFGPLTRITLNWQPCSLLCKRFNVPEPHLDELNTSRNKRRTKNLIFEYEQFKDVSVDVKAGLLHKKLDKEPAENEENNSSTVIESNMKENNTTLESNIEETATSREINKTNEEIIGDPPKDITEKIDVNKNIDLFKAVFLSSSESEDEDEKNQINKNVEMKSSILSDTLLPKIKPSKEGILSNMDFSIFKRSSDSSAEKSTKDIESKSTTSDSVQENTEFSYGPSLPATLSSQTCTTLDASLTQSRDYDDIDEWVEKTEKDKKHKNSNKKKHKNKKSSYKKKHKHNRERLY